MPHVSSIFPKLVSAVTIVMASSDATRNATKCEFSPQNKICSSILLFLDALILEYLIPNIRILVHSVGSVPNIPTAAAGNGAATRSPVCLQSLPADIQRYQHDGWA